MSLINKLIKKTVDESINRLKDEIEVEILKNLMMQINDLPTWRLGPDDCIQKYKALDIIFNEVKRIRRIK